MPDAVLRGRSITKSFRDGRASREVLRDVDLDVCAGQLVGLQGRSGCGKTTLVRIVTGVIRPDSGSVHIDGRELSSGHPRQIAQIRRDAIGLVPQSSDLLEHESVYDNVVLPLMFEHPRLQKRQMRRMYESVLSQVGLEVSSSSPVSILSGGEKQRLALARAIVRNPKLLVADEPTASLDSESGVYVTARLRALADSGVGVLVATHDRDVIDACDVVYGMSDPGVVSISR